MQEQNNFPNNYPQPAPQEPNVPPLPDLPPLPEIPPLPGEQPFIPDLPPQPVAPPPVAPLPPIATRASYSPPRPSANSTLLGMVIGAVAVLIILGLAATFYYFATNPIAPAPVIQDYAPPVPQEPQVIPTTVVRFTAPATLPTEEKAGNCWTASLAEPYREDAWRCTSGNVIYDPCFSAKGGSASGGETTVYCQMNPTVDSAFTIRLTKPLLLRTPLGRGS